ncbi:hypothetical protein BpHYR1_042495 [Brachionus plicatilis]|uniref:Uncharacterized protein n=1 Tax=Brachionus plicatilis TaxID=10195 RepID=A0A3M7SX17_BRAPC|nr:hypothetical protein BpHYR1_042495 [Brachionus plicatilis]
MLKIKQFFKIEVSSIFVQLNSLKFFLQYRKSCFECNLRKTNIKEYAKWKQKSEILPGNLEIWNGLESSFHSVDLLSCGCSRNIFIKKFSIINISKTIWRSDEYFALRSKSNKKKLDLNSTLNLFFLINTVLLSIVTTTGSSMTGPALDYYFFEVSNLKSSVPFGPVYLILFAPSFLRCSLLIK